MTIATDTNPYWDAVKDHVDPTGSPQNTPSVEGFQLRRTPTGSVRDESMPLRGDFVKRYSWTITDPATVAFVAEHAGPKVVDPMAGTGWWAYLLGQRGVDVVSYDEDPGGNVWHQGEPLHAPVARMAGVESVRLHPDRVLLLSWPPYNEPHGVDILRAYAGQRVIYIGEGEGEWCGDAAMFAEFATGWVSVAEHVPVRWSGSCDYVAVYDRKS